MQLSDFRSGVFTGAPGKAAASKFLWLLGCALPMAATLTLASGDSFALGFEYALDEFEVTGNLAFYDDFEDGLRDSPPTSALLDWQTSVSVEQDGHLILDSDNGFILRPDIGVGWIQGLVELSTKLPDGGTGTSTFAVSVRPDVPGLWPDCSMWRAALTTACRRSDPVSLTRRSRRDPHRGRAGSSSPRAWHRSW